MLAVKLLLVPMFLLAVSLAGRRWGPSVAGWLAGLPVVPGPILLIIAMERGTVFASGAAAVSLAAVFASVSFGVAYAWASLRVSWFFSMAAGLLAWALAAILLLALRASPFVSLPVAATTLMVAPRLFPPAGAASKSRALSPFELTLHMLAGAILTVLVTLAARAFGARMSGLLTVFPILGIVLAVFSHRSDGAVFAASLLRTMVTGLYSFCAFCLVVSFALLQVGIMGAFFGAVVVAVAVQLLTRRHLIQRSSRLTPLATPNPSFHSGPSGAK